MNVEVEVNPREGVLTWGDLRAFVDLGRNEPDDWEVLVHIAEDGPGWLVSLRLLDLDGRALAAAGERSTAETEWAVVDDGRVIHIAGATSPADALAGAHGHGTHGPIGVAHRTVTRTPWQHLTDQPTEETTDA